MSEKPFALAVKAVILDTAGRCLLLRRSAANKNFVGKWEWPGGKVDPGEDFATAVLRETQEEAGLVIEITGLAGATTFDMPHVHVVVLCMEAHLTGGTLTLSHEHDAAEWVTLQFLTGRGNPLAVVVACTGSGVEDSYGSGLTPAARAELREREQRRSARFFGLPQDCLTFLRLANDADDQAAAVPENLAILESFIRQQAPDLVFLPHGNDTNRGHQAMYAMVCEIAARLAHPPALLLIRDPKTIAMRTDLYFPFGETEAAWKAELLRFHDSQHQRNLQTRGHGFDERILALNRQIARELAIAAPYAEAFEWQISGF